MFENTLPSSSHNGIVRLHEHVHVVSSNSIKISLQTDLWTGSDLRNSGWFQMRISLKIGVFSRWLMTKMSPADRFLPMRKSCYPRVPMRDCLALSELPKTCLWHLNWLMTRKMYQFISHLYFELLGRNFGVCWPNSRKKCHLASNF